MFRQIEITYIDIGILIAYLILSKLIPLWLTRNKNEDSEGFFLGGKNFVWPMIGFSLFATNMSGASFVGLAGAGYSQGISVYSYEWMAALILIIFIFFLLPFYIKSGVFTMPQFLEKRYDYRLRRGFSSLLIFFAIFVDAASPLYAGALVGLIIFPGMDLWVGVVVLAVLSGVLSIFGGLGAVVISDAIQSVVLIVGGTLVFIMAYMAIPSWQEMVQAAPEGALSIIQPITDPSLPWPGLLTGVLIIGIYFWTANQTMVQRVLGAKTMDHGRWGAIFAGFLKLPILFIMILPGTMAIVLYPDLQSPDMVFPTLVADLMPIGVRGLILAALVAAITSTVDSVLNSVSTLVTIDFVKPLKPDISDKKLVIIGRVTTTLVMLIAVFWAPQIQHFPSLWTYLQSILCYTVPPIVAIFLGGVFWKKANRHGAFATFIIGIGMGILGFFTNEILGFATIHYLYSAALLFVISLIVLVVGSNLSAADDPSKTEGLIWSKELWDEQSRELAGTPLWKNYRFQSLILFLTTATIVIWFW